ncbi:MAG: TIGR04053 family radical SAM/SPASM domain-containing protein [Candidatus Bathyarchaeia archaeon]
MLSHRNRDYRSHLGLGRELLSTPFPHVVAWESTRACRFACVHCRADAQTKPDPSQLSTDEALRMVDEIAEFSQPLFIISGGDPLLRDDVFEVASKANAKGMRVVMSPSGSQITPEVVDSMIQSGIRRVSVSLDGSNPDSHDGFRRVPGSFELAHTSISVLKQEGMPFQINTTVTQHNLDDLPKIRDLVVELGAAAWDIFMLVPTGRARIRMEITPREYEETLNHVYDWTQSSLIPVKMTCAPHYRRVIAQREKGSLQRNPSTPIDSGKGATLKVSNVASGRQPSVAAGGRGCMAGNGFCFISHVGDVYGCGFLPIKAGNIREAHFRDIYQQSSLFNSLRNFDLLQGRCGVCEYRAICGGCRARALGASNSYLEEEPYCIYTPKRYESSISDVS